jgi:hypothetical protein
VSAAAETGKMYEMMCCENKFRCRDPPIQSWLYMDTEYDWEKK